MLVRCLLTSFFALLLVACETASTVPTAENLDAMEQRVRGDHRQHYLDLEDQRRSGQLTELEYADSKAALDKRVQNKVDTMLWSRHALVQSEMKANGIPTPDKPIENAPPGVGGVQNSLYNSQRQNGLGSQIQGNLMRDLTGGGVSNPRRAGTQYDQ